MSNTEISALEYIKSEPDNDDTAYINAEPNTVSSYNNSIKTEADLKYYVKEEDPTIKQEEIHIKEEIEINEDRDVSGSFSVESVTKHTSKVHVTTVHNMRRKKIVYQCNMCKFESSFERSLTKHIRMHTGEKPCVCPICEFKCSRKSALTEHMRIHTGEKPFVCLICVYKCSNKSNLAKHMRIHTGEKPFDCKICEYKTSDKSCLTRHIRVHTGEKQYDRSPH